MPGLYFESDIDLKKLDAKLNLIDTKISNLTSNVQRSGEEMQATFNKVGSAIGAYFSIQAISGFGQELINVRGEFQQLGIALETMLGSKDNADKLMAQIVDLSAKTPFSLTQVGQAVKQLLAYKESQEDVIDTTTRLGNVAAGLSVPLDRLIMAYGQVKAKGRLQGDDMRQFTEAGVPIVNELAKAFNVTEAEVYKLVETGKVGFEDVQKVIKNLTDEGGMFFNLMEKQSKSLTGMVSNLGDAWDRMLNDIGQGNEGVLAGSIQGLTSLVDNYEKVIDVVKVIAVTYGAYKAAVVASAIATNGLTLAENLHYAALVIAEKAQKLLNMTSLANPYVALATALAAVVSGLYLFSQSTDEVSEGQKRIAEASKRASESFAEQKGKIDLLRETAKNQALSDKQRYDAIKQLKDLMPDYNAEISNEGKLINESTTAIEQYLKQLELKIKMTAVQEEMAELWKREREEIKLLAEAQEKYNKEKEQKAQIDKLGYVNSGTSGAGMGGSVTNESAVSKANALKDEAQKNLDATRQALQELKDEYSGAEKSLTDFFNSTKDGTVETKLRTVDVIDAEIKKLKEDQQALSDTAKKWDEYQGKIDKLTKEREGITGTKKENKVTAKVGVWDEKEALEKDLQDFATYQDKRLAIINKYSQSRQRLEAQGYEEQAAEASAQMQKELDELDANQFKKSESYRWVYDNIDKMGRKALQDYIARLKQEIEAFQGNEEVKLELTKRLAEADEKLNEFTPKKIADVAGILGEMSTLAAEFDSNLAKALNTASSLASSLSTALMGFSSGNTLQGVSGLISAATSIIKLFNSESESGSDKLAQWIEKLVKVLQLQEDALALLSSKDKVNAYTQLLKTAQNDMDALIDKTQKSTDQVKNLYGNLYDTIFTNNGIPDNVQQWTSDDWINAIANSAGDYKKQLEEAYSEWLKLNEQQQEYLDAQYELLTGTTYDSIVSSIRDGFADGYSSIEDFADGFEELMRNAILQSLQVQYLEPALQAWYSQFANANQDGLSQTEIDALRTSYNAIITNAENYANSLAEAAGITLSNTASNSDNTISGAIKGMSQESADLLAGQLGAMRIHLADIASVVTGGFNSDLRLDTTDIEQSFGIGLNAINNAILQSNDYLKQIAQNTASIEEMKSILAGGITIKNSRGYDDSFNDRRIRGN